jgi:histidinol-phosphate aminotransferase
MGRTKKKFTSPEPLIRPLVRALQPYVPGEQPKIEGLVKLNTNENPYPPSPHVLQTVKAAVDGRLRLYPNPTAEALRGKLAKLHGCAVENIIVGNGCDDVLAMATRAFVEPRASRNAKVLDSRSLVQYFTPSYSLYPVLAEMHGAATNPMPLNPDFSMPGLSELKWGRLWDFDAALSLITTPNAPSGRAYATRDFEALAIVHPGILLLDETYADFAPENALALALKYPHVLVARSFSKAYSLCFQRVGYAVGHPALIGAMHKIRDSYNVNGLGQLAAEATLDDLDYCRARFREIIAARDRVSRDLAALGCRVLPSHTNFILVRPPTFPAEAWLQKLRERKILVRWFNTRELRDYLRISIGTPAEMHALIKTMREILRSR